MTAELRNLPHITSMAFNEPLMLEPAYARVFFCALAGQLGISRLTDAVSGDSLTAGEAPAALALSVDDDGPRQARSYQVMNGIAVLPVSGTLVSRTRALQPYSGMTGLQRHYRPSATGCQRPDGGRHSARYGYARRDGGRGI
ncbi:minor capsid protein C from bacteriophage origin [Escherichia coli]|uniref:Minor capsid protein C from bacteriophage origin n=1 Tax=Escherichia coli TaxID=562 RepID=A0A376VLP7_ECOLX|nr:minor capsid protein C from bacteriophage origin [Escherichia coli]